MTDWMIHTEPAAAAPGTLRYTTRGGYKALVHLPGPATAAVVAFLRGEITADALAEAVA